MKVCNYENVNEVAVALERELKERLAKKKAPLRVFLPTGNSPRPLYERLRQRANFWKGNLDVLQIDEFVGSQRLFFTQLQAEVVGPLDLKMASWEPDLDDNQIIEHVDTVLSRPIDVAILGLGPNGHVGFHEPGMPRDFLGGRAKISDATKLRVAGATTNAVVTFGVGAFLKAKEIFLIVTGREKEKIFQELEKTEPTENLPASLLKVHPHLTVFMSIQK